MIPSDIRRTAIIAFNTAADVPEWGTGEPYDIIARVILAERFRCAEIVRSADPEDLLSNIADEIMRGEE